MAPHASIKSHGPEALSYMVKSNFLPADPPADAYRWTTYGGRANEVDEQILATGDCVVWSRNGIIRNVLTFKTKAQTVDAAFLTNFVTFARLARRKDQDSGCATQQSRNESSRALCVVLDRQIQIHFTSGASYTLSIPFQIEQAIAAPDGLLVERRQGVPTPRSWPDTGLARDDEIPSVYTISDPVAGLCPLYQISPIANPRASVPYGLQGPVDYGEIHRDHALIRATSIETRQGDSATMLFTSHRESGHLSVWQMWRADAHTLAPVLSSDTSMHKISQATRRSSVFNTPLGGSTTTPNYRRGHEALRGYAAMAAPSAPEATTTRRRTRKSRAQSNTEPTDEPSIHLEGQLRAGSKQTRASRRASSLLSRTDLVGDPYPSVSAGNRSSRRGPSFGGPNDRKSLGASTFRKSRGSTINSLLAPSFESSQFSMDLDGEQNQMPTQLELDQLGQLGRPPTSVDYALNLEVDGPSHEFVMRKICSIPGETYAGHAPRYKIEVLELEDGTSTSIDADIALLFILNIATQHLSICHIRRAMLATDSSSIQRSANEQSLSILSITPHSTAGDCLDIMSLRQQSVPAVACLQPKNKLCIYSVNGTTRSTMLTPSDSDGENHQTVNATALCHATSAGLVSVYDQAQNIRRVRVKLVPKDPRLNHLLHVLTRTLGGSEARAMSSLYATILSRLQLEHDQDEVSTEWNAMITTMFVFAMGSVVRTTASHARRKSARVSSHTLDADLSCSTGRLSSGWQWLRDSSASQENSIKKLSALGTGMLMKTSMLEFEAMARHLLHEITTDELLWLRDDTQVDRRGICLVKILFAAHLWREDQKLSTLSAPDLEHGSAYLLPALAQIGRWLELPAWDYQPGSYYYDESDRAWELSDTIIDAGSMARRLTDTTPASILAWLEQVIRGDSTDDFPKLEHVARLACYANIDADISSMLPNSFTLTKLAHYIGSSTPSPQAVVEALQSRGLTGSVLNSCLEAISAKGRAAAIASRSKPASTWSTDLLRSVGRQDLAQSLDNSQTNSQSIPAELNSAPHALTAVLGASEHSAHLNKTVEVERHVVTHLIFPEDRRFMDARDITNPQADQVAECPPEPFWSEAQHLEQQKRVSQFVMTRTLSLPPGDAMINFASQQLVLSERLQFPEFSIKCKMKPMNIISVADQTSYTEEKVGWASFHRGVARGLYISRDATGIETSWIIFNKPKELTNRHAGLLLALGLTGRLRSMAKWLSYDYLQSRHAMTSVGLLLGLAASSIGTMDTLITRPLSIHIMRMLPPGTSPLNTPLITQTAGLFGLGLVYCNTRHRRMSEVMLTELEHCEVEEAENNLDTIADESYRLAAGFALGYINLGQGGNLVGLYGLDLLPRLLSMAVGSRPIEVTHIMDKCIPAAVIAVALIYMKTGDRGVAQKLDNPGTLAQLEHVRPDVLLLRSMAKHVIMWDDMKAESGWVRRQIPPEPGKRFFGVHGTTNGHVPVKARLTSENVPYFNVIAGCAWALSLKYAGSGNPVARDEVLSCLEVLQDVAKEEAYYYDAMLAKNTVRRCIDLLALAAATVMAGTGDLITFRYLRRLHGRVDAGTTYGSHLAAHLAIGALFLGGGTYTFGTSDMAVASLICAFYPIFPADVSDNSAHLQALRHMWVLAAEARCVVTKDLDSDRPVCMDLEVLMRDGSIKPMRTPCLLPDLDMIQVVRTIDPAYWQIELDFGGNPSHLARFRDSQVLYVRQKSTREISPVLFDSCLAELNEFRTRPVSHSMWQWFLNQSNIRRYDQSDLNAVLGPASQNAIQMSGSATAIDDRLALARDAKAESRRGLWNLRLLFAWAERVRREGGDVPWLGTGAVKALRSELDKRLLSLAQSADRGPADLKMSEGPD